MICFFTSTNIQSETLNFIWDVFVLLGRYDKMKIAILILKKLEHKIFLCEEIQDLNRILKDGWKHLGYPVYDLLLDLKYNTFFFEGNFGDQI